MNSFEFKFSNSYTLYEYIKREYHFGVIIFIDCLILLLIFLLYNVGRFKNTINFDLIDYTAHLIVLFVIFHIGLSCFVLLAIKKRYYAVYEFNNFFIKKNNKILALDEIKEIRLIKRRNGKFDIVAISKKNNGINFKDISIPSVEENLVNKIRNFSTYTNLINYI